MNAEIANHLGDALIDAGSRIKAGNSEISEEQAISLISTFAHVPISREEVCLELNISDDTFYRLLNLGKIPQGKKRKGFKELCWYKDEIHYALNKIRGKH